MCITNILRRLGTSFRRQWILILVLAFTILILNLGWTLYIFPYNYDSILKPPGVIVKVIQGTGIGNQLFRYACSYTLAKKLKVPLYLYLPSHLNFTNEGRMGRNTQLKDPNLRSFILDQFHIPMDNAISSRTWISGRDVFEFYDWHLLHKSHELSQEVVNNKLLMHVDYCESETFFYPYETELRELFVPKIDDKIPYNLKHWIDLIESGGDFSVGIHIRRGDYVTFGGQFWVTPIQYYRRAMEIMIQKLVQNDNFKSKNLKFFIFSDDIEYAKENLLLGNTNTYLDIFKNVHYVSTGKGVNATLTLSSLEEFYLMTKCKHMIIANSTFSWWAAYLIGNKNKIVIGAQFHPKFFDHYLDNYTRDFKLFVFKLWYPSQWIVIDPYNL